VKMALPVRTVELQEVVRFASGGTPSKGNPANWGGDVPWLSAKDLKTLNLHDSQDHLTTLGAKGATLAPVGSILILVRGMTLLKDLPIGVVMRAMAFNQDVKALHPCDDLRPYYLAYYLISRKQEILQSVETAGHGTGRLDTDFLKTFPIELPGLDEQDDIIKILSAWDAAIENASALLLALEQRKKGLMQQLLTGRRRLKGFKGTWKSMQIDSFAKNASNINKTGHILPVLSCTKYDGLVDSLSYFSKQIFSENTNTYKLVSRGQFAYATNHIEEGSIGYQDVHDLALISPMYTVFEVDAALVDHSFLYKLLKTEAMRRIFESITHSSVDRRGSLRWPEFAKLKISIPPVLEQQAIAAVIDVASTEIELVQEQLAQLKTQKRALTQKLLSGEWRLPKATVLKEFSV
jgi:type I restriction enzyme, S subunit